MKDYSTNNRRTHWKYTNESHLSSNRLSIKNTKRQMKKNYRQKLKRNLRREMLDN